LDKIRVLPRSLTSLELDVQATLPPTVCLAASAELPPSLTHLSIPLDCLRTPQEPGPAVAVLARTTFHAGVDPSRLVCVPLHLKSLTSLILHNDSVHHYLLEALPASLTRLEMASTVYNSTPPFLAVDEIFAASLSRHLRYLGVYLQINVPNALELLPTSLNTLQLMYQPPSILPSLNLPFLSTLHLVGLDTAFSYTDLAYLPRILQDLLVIDFVFPDDQQPSEPLNWPPYLHTLRIMGDTANLSEQNVNIFLPPSLTFLQIPNSRVRPLSRLRRGLVIQARPIFSLVEAPPEAMPTKKDSCTIS
jgi:hypothetical protein